MQLPVYILLSFLVFRTACVGADDSTERNIPDATFHPQKVAAGSFEMMQLASKIANKAIQFTYTRVQYNKKTFWVAEAHYGDGVPYKTIAVYAQERDGSFLRCLFAESNQAGLIAAAVDSESGMLELREQANSKLRGEVVLSCNLKTVGTLYSTTGKPESDAEQGGTGQPATRPKLKSEDSQKPQPKAEGRSR